MIKVTRPSARLLVACEFKGQKSTGGRGSGNEARFLSRERSVRMQLTHRAHVRIAYFTPAAGMILCAMMIELHVEFRNRLQTPINRAYEQDGNFHDHLK